MQIVKSDGHIWVDILTSGNEGFKQKPTGLTTLRRQEPTLLTITAVLVVVANTGGTRLGSSLSVKCWMIYNCILAAPIHQLSATRNVALIKIYVSSRQEHQPRSQMSKTHCDNQNYHQAKPWEQNRVYLMTILCWSLGFLPRSKN